MSSRDIAALLPDVAAMASAMLAECERQGLHVIVACTYRSNEEQAALYAQGRTKGGAIVTYAKPGQSKHNTRQALDIYPITNGKLTGTSNPTERDIWQQLGRIGKAAGFEWGGDWHMQDLPHFQTKG